ncbi:palmitoyl-protein thioesterase 1-like [Diabrotica undecimpunctata]|uniref:palmitoyl-protein thioesterase 1-like n=1 Tax=Diabrotica undecimpunctata TaxID=50387 RepID=UPI003B63EE64
MKTRLFILLSIFYLTCDVNAKVPPIVLWHGMGDSCCFSFSLGAFSEKLNTTLGGTYIHSIQIGNNLIEDVLNGFFRHPDQQIDEVCEKLGSDPELANGFNAIGFSQGGQFLRALVQRCPKVKVLNLISLGGQHQGVYGLPRCAIISEVLCDYIRQLLNGAAYEDFVQKDLVQATYWHDPLDENLYKEKSTFLADINNEKTINAEYSERIKSLENLVLVKFLNDTMVEPVESEWFGFYKPGQAEEILPLLESPLYTEDRLGLGALYASKKLHLLQVEGEHLRFKWAWFEENILPYLKE